MPTGGTGPDVSGHCKFCDKNIWGIDHRGLVQTCEVSSDGFHEPGDTYCCDRLNGYGMPEPHLHVSSCAYHPDKLSKLRQEPRCVRCRKRPQQEVNSGRCWGCVD